MCTSSFDSVCLIPFYISIFKYSPFLVRVTLALIYRISSSCIYYVRFLGLPLKNIFQVFTMFAAKNNFRVFAPRDMPQVGGSRRRRSLKVAFADLWCDNHPVRLLSVRVFARLMITYITSRSIRRTVRKEVLLNGFMGSNLDSYF